jgi:hypothetical protein
MKKTDYDNAPYLVDPDQLRALGIDPDPYLKSGSHKGGPDWAGWMLDRKRDAALIARLESMREQHRTVQWWLSTELAKSEREVRDTALDRDRWKKRAQEAEAAIKSAGINKSKQYQHNNGRDHSDQAEQIGI